MLSARFIYHNVYHYEWEFLLRKEKTIHQTAAGLILFDCQMAAGGYKNTDQMIINRNAAKMPIEERCNKQQKFGKNETQFEKEDFLNQTMCGKSFVEKLTEYNKKEIELDYEGRNKGKKCIVI